MFILKARNITKSFADEVILNDVSFDLLKNERVGIVGANGAGKTTLAKIIYGQLAPDSGKIEKQQNISIGYLHQSVDNEIHEEALSSKEFYLRTSELGLQQVQNWTNEQLANLSGGERLKITLAQIWATQPELLILDEPTNHLDFQGVNWLINELKHFNGTVLIISHDRYFLDKAVSTIYDLEQGYLTIYSGNYTTYREKKQKLNADKLHQYEIMQKYKANVEQQINQLQQWSGKAHRNMNKQEGFKEYHGVKAKKIDKAIKSKMKRLNQELEKKKIEKPIEEAPVRFQFAENKKRGKRMVEAERLEKSFGKRTLFKDSSFYINNGERIGLIGPNGSGKTTLLNMIIGHELQTSGKLIISQANKVAYLSQDVGDMPLSIRAIDALELTDQEEQFKARTILANMGIHADKLMQPIATLSLGERTRIKLTKILLQGYNLLILDEPTNHLDLASREQLEAALTDFTGTLLIVSHDYYFMNKLCNKLLVIENEKIIRVEMNLEQYEKRKQSQSEPNIQGIKEELLCIETEITAVLGQMSLILPSSEEYTQLDQKFLSLTKRKRELINLLDKFKK